MTDPLDNLQRRLGWINRALIAGAIVIVVALAAFVVHRLRAPARPAPGASQPASAALPRASAPAVMPAPGSAPLALPAAPGAGSAPAAAASAARAAGGVGAQPAASAPAGVAPSARPQPMPQRASQPAVQAAAQSAATSVPPAAQPLSQAASQPAFGADAQAPSKAASGPAPTRAARHAARHHARASSAARSANAGSALCTREGWYVQVGAFAETASYQHLSARLQHVGLAHCRGPKGPHGLHVLLVGPYPTREAAQHVRSRLKAPLRDASYLRHLGATH